MNSLQSLYVANKKSFYNCFVAFLSVLSVEQHGLGDSRLP